MEEHANNGCSVVYYCASAPDEIYELYHKNSPPEAPSEIRHENTSLNLIYQNIRAMLDEDQGGFDEGEEVNNRRESDVLVLIIVSFCQFAGSAMSRSTGQLCKFGADRSTC